LTLSLRAEWENGAKGKYADFISGFDPNAQLPISAGAQAAYATGTASQVPELAASNFLVKGGALQVEVKQGVVTLSGAVEQDKQKEKAEKIAKKVKGVKQVVNNIDIKTHPAK